MIRAVFFDLDGTLYDRDSVMRNLVEEQFGVFRESLGGVSESQFVQRILELDAHGHGDNPLLYESVVLGMGARSRTGWPPRAVFSGTLRSPLLVVR